MPRTQCCACNGESGSTNVGCCTLASPSLLQPWVRRAAALLEQHPRAFLERAAPWLRQRLGWGDAELAAAALTPFFAELCRLDLAHAERWAAWLTGPEVGLTQGQAGQLLLADVRLLVGPERELGDKRAAVAGMAAAAKVAPPLAAALCLSQPFLTASGTDRTVQLVGVLLVSGRAGGAPAARFFPSQAVLLRCCASAAATDSGP